MFFVIIHGLHIYHHTITEQYIEERHVASWRVLKNRRAF